MDLTNTDYQQVETENKEAKETYTKIYLLSGLNYNRYIQLINYLHNAFRMVCDNYPKDLTSAYELAINCKGNTVYVAVPPNDW